MIAKLACMPGARPENDSNCMKQPGPIMCKILHVQETCLVSCHPDRRGCEAGSVVLQDAQTAEVQAYFSQWGPVNSCQLAHNDSALIALVSRQGPLQAGSMHTLIAPQCMQCAEPLSQLESLFTPHVFDSHHLAIPHSALLSCSYWT